MSYTNNIVNGVLVPLTQDEINDLLARDAAANSLDAKRTRQKVRLAALRYRKETGGIMLGGTAIKTDRESQALITGAWCRAQQRPDVLIDWKGEAGWAQIDAATISAIADAVGAHVQACFSNERVLCDAIDAAIDPDNCDLTTGWK